MAQHNFGVKGKHEGGSGLDVQQCSRCGLVIWPGSLRKDIGGSRWQLYSVLPETNGVPCDPEWPQSEQQGWMRRDR